MESVEWFASMLEIRFGINAKWSDVGYEANVLYQEEMDESLIPKEHLEKLPNPILLEILIYHDLDGNE